VRALFTGTIDWSDAAAVAGFWATVLGRHGVAHDTTAATEEGASGPSLVFDKVPDTTTTGFNEAS
jgi:hypothetical protein